MCVWVGGEILSASTCFQTHGLFNFMNLSLKVWTFLEQALKELTSTWIHGIKYNFSVVCPCNDLQQPPQPDVSRCIHLLPLEECLNKAKIKCKDKKILVQTEVFKKWFQDVAAEDSLDRSEWLFVFIQDSRNLFQYHTYIYNLHQNNSKKQINIY